MAQFPALPFWTDAYLGDTTHLTTIEHGAYLLLLISMWRSSEGSLPNDDKLLSRYAKLTRGQWNRVKPVLMPFFKVENHRIYQSRLTDELMAVRRLSKSQSHRARSRHLKDKETGHAVALSGQCPADASPTPTPTPTPTLNNDNLRTQSRAREAPDPSPPPPKPVTDYRKLKPRTPHQRDVRRYGEFVFDPKLPPDAFPEHWNAKDDCTCSAFDPRAFDGKVIKLRMRDFDAWRQQSGFTEAYFTKWLDERDDWLAEQPAAMKEKWFLSTSQALSRERQFERLNDFH